MFYLLLIVLLVSRSVISDDIIIKIYSQSDLKNFTVVQKNIEHTGRNAAISILSDGTHRYILKQDTSDNFNALLSRIKEVIVSAIGCSHDISLDINGFIPCDVGQDLKIYKNKCATLHLLVPGQSIAVSLPSFVSKNFRISQRYRPYEYEYKHGFEIQYGLCDATIRSMSLHKDLPGIVAIDTFFGNFDRDTDNVFYDEVTDKFYGIDQGAAFSGDLPFLPICAYYELCSLQSTGYFLTCSRQCIDGLRLYKDALKTLCKHCTAAKIMIAFDQLIPLVCNDFDQKLKKNKKAYVQTLEFYMTQSHQICVNIVDQIELILQEIDRLSLC